MQRRTFWLSHGQNPFTLAVFVDSLVLVGLVDLFVITPGTPCHAARALPSSSPTQTLIPAVSIERLWLTLFAWAAFTACAYNFYVAWRADPGFLKPPVADQKRVRWTRDHAPRHVAPSHAAAPGFVIALILNPYSSVLWLL
jgi:hypothetical protein